MVFEERSLTSAMAPQRRSVFRKWMRLAWRMSMRSRASILDPVECESRVSMWLISPWFSCKENAGLPEKRRMCTRLQRTNLYDLEDLAHGRDAVLEADDDGDPEPVVVQLLGLGDRLEHEDLVVAEVVLGNVL